MIDTRRERGTPEELKARHHDYHHYRHHHHHHHYANFLEFWLHPGRYNISPGSKQRQIVVLHHINVLQSFQSFRYQARGSSSAIN